MIPILFVAVIVVVAQGGANLSSLQVCGTPNRVDVGSQNSSSRIVGGVVCKDCQWMASLDIHITDRWKNFCGGTIIRQMWIVSAAQCFKSTTKPEDVKIRVGSPYPDWAGKLCQVKKIIIHKRYRLMENDIALIRLSKKITFDENIKPLTLVKKPWPLGSYLSVSGWGRTTTQLSSATSPDYYMHAELMLVKCKKRFIIPENVICAYETDKSPCFLDSGGPLYDAKTLQLVGVISCVENANCTGLGFFADVFRLSDWIEDNIDKTDNPPKSGSSYYRPVLVYWLFTLLHPLHSFHMRFC